MSGYYPAGLTDYTPGCPWSEPEVPEMDFEITCSQSLSRTATVTTNNYIPCVEEGYDDGVGYHDEWADTSETDWSKEYDESGYCTPLQLIQLFKEYLQRDLNRVDALAEERHENKAFLERKLKSLIEECDCWTEDDIEFCEG